MICCQSVWLSPPSSRLSGSQCCLLTLLTSYAAVSVYRYGVCLSHLPPAAVCSDFAAVGPTGRQYWLIAAGRVCSIHGQLSVHIHSSMAVSTQQQMRAVLCLQQRREVNRDLLYIKLVAVSGGTWILLRSFPLKWWFKLAFCWLDGYLLVP